ncbi:hypothetical protein BN988_02111 [Oceanobacillus picturae]|uniref:Uncharacterized protein n=1 Tax=Oceanobacillus picturae TaxID=171693 RepID=W9AD13_9BACI|nr:hypothetical protein D1864_13505 [Oceanobacillus picturae]CDO03594.1 hypothetical protein BN988_02111 [Oceanobacillus picturae]
MLLLVALYLSYVFEVPIIDVFVPLLIFALVLSVFQITWYNKKKNIKTMARDWVVIAICLIILMIWGFLKLQENKLENEVYDVIEEKVQDETFSIEFIDEVDYYEEKYFVVSYTIKGDPTEYLEWYYRKDGEWLHDETK